MEPHPEVSTEMAAGRRNSRLALLIFGAVAIPCLGLDALANDPRVLDGVRRGCWVESIWTKQIPMYCFTDHFLDSEDRLLHQELPAADFSRGSVCLFGASSMNWALHLWDLPESTRSLIHNYAMSGSNHGDQLRLIRNLVEGQGLLRAGGGKTLAVFGVSYHMTHNAKLPGEKPEEYFDRLWTRRGFYRIDPDGTIRRNPLNPAVERVIVERAKITGLLRELVNLAYTPFKRVRVIDPEVSRQEWARTLGPRWEEKIRADVAQFARTIEYLRARDVRIMVIAMPEGSWNEGSPYEKLYMSELGAVCSRAGIPIEDLRKTIPDDDFADSVHLNPAGIEKFQQAVLPTFLDHLRSTGALPSDRP